MRQQPSAYKISCVTLEVGSLIIDDYTLLLSKCQMLIKELGEGELGIVCRAHI